MAAADWAGGAGGRAGFDPKALGKGRGRRVLVRGRTRGSGRNAYADGGLTAVSHLILKGKFCCVQRGGYTDVILS